MSAPADTPLPVVFLRACRRPCRATCRHWGEPRGVLLHLVGVDLTVSGEELAVVEELDLTRDLVGGELGGRERRLDLGGYETGLVLAGRVLLGLGTFVGAGLDDGLLGVGLGRGLQLVPLSLDGFVVGAGLGGVLMLAGLVLPVRGLVFGLHVSDRSRLGEAVRANLAPPASAPLWPPSPPSPAGSSTMRRSPKVVRWKARIAAGSTWPDVNAERNVHGAGIGESPCRVRWFALSGVCPARMQGSSSSGGSDSRGAAHMLAGDAQLRTEFAVLDDLDADPLQVRALG